jgi:hypothetical protein
MARKGLTKGQRRRANQRRRKQSAILWEETMGPVPEHIEQFFKSVEPNITTIERGEPWENAPPHMVDYDECPGLNTDALTRLNEKASVSRTQERNQQISELKAKYLNYWGKRGGARFIAKAETDTGSPITGRTVQKYFKLTKI